MTIELREVDLAAGGALYRRYCGEGLQAEVASVQGLFEHSPADLALAAGARATAVDSQYDCDRTALADALSAYNLRIGAPPAAIAAARRLSDPRALAVVTGQQAGLFTGPLYSLYKAIGAVVLARRLETALERPVVPIFWAATEDHDLAEADHGWFLDGTESWQRIRYVPPGIAVANQSVGSVPLDRARVDDAVDRLAAVLPPGPATSDAIARARATGRQAGSLGEWFCRLVASICGPLGIPVLDPMQPAMRRLAAPMVARLLGSGREVAAALAKGSERVRELGYEPQINAGPLDVNLFHYPRGPDGPRVALEFSPGGDGLRLRGELTPLGTSADLMRLAAADPERFSGNVVTRPVLQDAVLPTVAYVAGPGEIGYYAMLRGCYQAVGRTMPLIWPRPTLTVVAPAVARLLAKRGLEGSPFPAGIDEARRQVVAAADGVGIPKLFGDLRAAVDRAYGPVLPSLTGFDGVLGSLAGKNRERVRRELDWLERKSWQVARQRSSTELRQIDRIEAHLWPRGGPQERTACGLGLLAAHGDGLVAELAAAIEPGPPHRHYFVYLG